MNKGIFRSIKLAVLAVFLFAAFMPFSLAIADTNNVRSTASPVYVVPIHGEINSGLFGFLHQSFKAASKEFAQQIVLDIDTPGGAVKAAEEMGRLIRESSIPVVAYVHGTAASAGSYISLNAHQIIMAPGSSMGAAAVVDLSGQEVVSAKIVGYWAGQMRSAAELRGRNPVIAEGMVDKDMEITLPEINKTFGKGQIVSLTAEEALKVGYAEATAANLQEVLAHLGLQDARVVHLTPAFAVKLASFLTNPIVMTLLLLIGIAGVAIELFVPGFGFPGIIGIIGFALYFFGHYVIGFAGMEEMVLFAIGVVLLIIEVFLPSFGIIGIIGIICVISGVVLAAYDAESAMISLGVAFLVAIVVVIVVAKIFKKRGIWNRFILQDEQRNEEGYTSTTPKDSLLGKTGIALTPLRPAGTARIDGERVDVVTSGEFISAQKPIQVIIIEGTRVVVSEITT